MPLTPLSGLKKRHRVSHAFQWYTIWYEHVSVYACIGSLPCRGQRIPDSTVSSHLKQTRMLSCVPNHVLRSLTLAVEEINLKLTRLQLRLHDSSNSEVTHLMFRVRSAHPLFQGGRMPSVYPRPHISHASCHG